MSIWKRCWPIRLDGKASSHLPFFSWHGCPDFPLGYSLSFDSRVLYTNLIHGEHHINGCITMNILPIIIVILWTYFYKFYKIWFVYHRFNYRATAYMVQHGFYNFLNWFDERAWYPLGRIVGGTVYPGLMLTSGAIHYVLHALNIPVHIRDICVFLAPIFR